MGRFELYLNQELEAKLKALMEKVGFKNWGEAIRFCITDAYQRHVEGEDIKNIIEKLKQEISKGYENFTEEKWREIGKLLREREKLRIEVNALKNEKKEAQEELAKQEAEIDKNQLMKDLRKLVDLTKDYYDTFKEETAKQILQLMQKIIAKQEEIEIAEKIKIQKPAKKKEKWYYTQ